MVLKETGELILIVETGAQVFADGSDIARLQPIVQSLIIAIVEALLLQGPFQIPINLSLEGEGWIGLAHRRRRRRPERLRADAPCALENLGQHQHRHVAADTIAFAGNADQFIDLHLL